MLYVRDGREVLAFKM